MNGRRQGLAGPVSGGALLLLLFSLAACSTAPRPGPDQDPSPREPRQGGTLVVGIRNDLDSLNPYLSVQSQARDITYQIFASLMEEQADFGQGPPTFLPQLASSWDRSDDGLEITFHLQPEAVWTDGQPITAEDVRFSWKAATNPYVAWLGSDAKKEIKNVEVRDAHTVVVHYARVYPYQLMDMNDGVIIPAHIWSKVPFKDWRTSGLDRSPVSSGPFRLKEWIPNQSIEMVKNDGFYESGLPLLDRLVYRIVPDSIQGFESFLRGELDFWDQIRPVDQARMETHPGVKLETYPDRYVCFIAWNTQRPLFSTPEIRLALTLGINRRRMVDDLFDGSAELASGILPPFYWAHDTKIQPYPYDPEKAARLLAAADYIDADGDGTRERNGAPFKFHLDITAGDSLRQDMAIMIQEDLSRLGIEVQIKTLERRLSSSRHRAGDFDAFIGAWRLPTKVDLSVIFHSRAIKTGGNFGGYRNPELDELLDRADQASVASQAKPLFDAAQEILHREQPYTFLYWQSRLVGISSRVEGAVPNAQSPLFHLDQWWVTHPAAQP